MQNETFVSAYFPHRLAREVRIAAATLGISRSEFMRRAASEYLTRVKQPGREPGRVVQEVQRG